MAVIICMAAILAHGRERTRETEADTAEIRQAVEMDACADNLRNRALNIQLNGLIGGLGLGLATVADTVAGF